MATLVDEAIRKVQSGDKALEPEEAASLASDLTGWRLEKNHLLTECKFEDFDRAMEFVNNVAVLASAADHHPDITISYNRVTLQLTTHKVNGLTRNDFILAARINEVAGGQCSGVG